jgi:hypothetical protein
MAGYLAARAAQRESTCRVSYTNHLIKKMLTDFASSRTDPSPSSSRATSKGKRAFNPSVRDSTRTPTRTRMAPTLPRGFFPSSTPARSRSYIWIADSFSLPRPEELRLEEAEDEGSERMSCAKRMRASSAGFEIRSFPSESFSKRGGRREDVVIRSFSTP